MGFPVETVDGETVDIVDKVADGLLVAEDGSMFKPTTDALKSELVEAGDALEAAFDAAGDLVDEAGDVVDAAGDVVEAVLDAPVEAVKWAFDAFDGDDPAPSPEPPAEPPADDAA